MNGTAPSKPFFNWLTAMNAMMCHGTLTCLPCDYQNGRTEQGGQGITNNWNQPNQRIDPDP